MSKSFKQFFKDLTTQGSTSREKEEAIGLSNLPKNKKILFTPHDDLFPDIPIPKSNDWLANFSESGQTFSRFKKFGYSNLISSKKKKTQQKISKKIYIQSIGKFEKNMFKKIKNFCEIYFHGASVHFLLPFEIEELSEKKIFLKIDFDSNEDCDVLYDKLKIKTSFSVGTRKGYRKVRQICTTDVLDCAKCPDDGLCLLFITMEDLFPNEKWNFVFGEASLRNKVGIFSFSRQHPKFPNMKNKLSDKELNLFLHRSIKTVVHEVIHMFNIEHCIYFSCVMQGANHLQESDSQPLFLCPVCLRKVELVFKFDVVKRYEKMYEFFKNNKGFEKEKEWIEKRLKFIKK